jgi:cytochrome c-type biogenesis protein CcmE
MTDANPTYLDFLRKAQKLIDQKQFLQASLELFAAAELLGSHPERYSVLRWAEQCRAKAKFTAIRGQRRSIVLPQARGRAGLRIMAPQGRA